MSGTLTLLIGGVRAGKSRRAVALANERAADGRVLFVATAQPLDDEMASRIAAHQRERPPHWDTLESPLDLARDIERAWRQAPTRHGVLVVDCLTLWVSNVLLAVPDDADADAELVSRAVPFIDVLTRSAQDGAHVIVVTNEVGLGIVPPTSLGRRYRDALGRVNQLVADAATDVWLMVAGLELPLKAGGALPGQRRPS
jgi:adenosyl cobinamide kinase/adenosyl cobinamide phosphate guanylyltransferase